MPVGIAGKLIIPTLPIVLLPAGNVGNDEMPTVPILFVPVGIAGKLVTPTLPIVLLPGGIEGIEVTDTAEAIPPPPLTIPPSTSEVNQIETLEEEPPVTIRRANPAPAACPEALPDDPEDNDGAEPIVTHGPVAVGAICNDIRKDAPVVTDIKAITIAIPSGNVITLVVDVPKVETPDLFVQTFCIAIVISPLLKLIPPCNIHCLN